MLDGLTAAVKTSAAAHNALGPKKHYAERLRSLFALIEIELGADQARRMIRNELGQMTRRHRMKAQAEFKAKKAAAVEAKSSRARRGI